MPVEHSAGAVIFRKEKGNTYYLLLQYDDNYWGFSKGRIEKKEKLQDTIRREVEEETRLTDIQFIEGFKETINYFFKREGKTIFKTNVYFLTETKTKEIKLSFEHIGFKWLPFDKAVQQVTFKNAKQILKKANEFLKAGKIQGAIL